MPSARLIAFSLLASSAALGATLLWQRFLTPYYPDLYQRIYGSSGHHQAESTDLFLLGFPAMCMAISLLLLWQSRSGGLFASAKFPALLIPIAIYACFAVGALIRLVAVRAFVGN